MHFLRRSSPRTFDTSLQYAHPRYECLPPSPPCRPDLSLGARPSLHSLTCGAIESCLQPERIEHRFGHALIHHGVASNVCPTHPAHEPLSRAHLSLPDVPPPRHLLHALLMRVCPQSPGPSSRAFRRQRLILGAILTFSSISLRGCALWACPTTLRVRDLDRRALVARSHAQTLGRSVDVLSSICRVGNVLDGLLYLI